MPEPSLPSNIPGIGRVDEYDLSGLPPEFYARILKWFPGAVWAQGFFHKHEPGRCRIVIYFYRMTKQDPWYWPNVLLPRCAERAAEFVAPRGASPARLAMCLADEWPAVQQALNHLKKHRLPDFNWVVIPVTIDGQEEMRILHSHVHPSVRSFLPGQALDLAILPTAAIDTAKGILRFHNRTKPIRGSKGFDWRAPILVNNQWERIKSHKMPRSPIEIEGELRTRGFMVATRDSSRKIEIDVYNRDPRLTWKDEFLLATGL